MLSYCLKCRKSTESKNLRVVKTKSGIHQKMVSNCDVCGSKNSRFIKEQEASGMLGNLFRTKIPVLRDLSTNILL